MHRIAPNEPLQPIVAEMTAGRVRSFNAARDYILVWRQSGGCLELSREMIRAEMDDGRQLVQRRTASEIFHDVLNDCAELVV